MAAWRVQCAVTYMVGYEMGTNDSGGHWHVRLDRIDLGIINPVILQDGDHY